VRLDAGIVGRLIASQFPHLARLPVASFGAGWDRPGTGHTWIKQKGFHYAFGATVLGVGIGAETDYSAVTTLTYTAGKSSQYLHWTWGDKGNPEYGGQGGRWGAWPEIIHTLEGTPALRDNFAATASLVDIGEEAMAPLLARVRRHSQVRAHSPPRRLHSGVRDIVPRRRLLIRRGRKSRTGECSERLLHL
jgi:hypothetical protein